MTPGEPIRIRADLDAWSWVRDAALALLVAHKNGRCPETLTTGQAWLIAEDLWRRYYEKASQ